MSYEFLQNYWWFVVSLLGGILVFLLFVQGANSVARSLGRTEEERRMVYNSTGRKWEFTFTTLVTFGGAFFASFPLFYSTSFGGAYWLWMIILFTFVLQAVSYEFQNKIGNILGPRTFQFFLTLNGIVGPLLLGGAVATFFEGSNFIIAKENLVDAGAITPVISHWANASHGLDALFNPWVLIFGFAVVFLARVLGILYIINNVDDENIRSRASVRLVGAAVPFVVLFVAYLVHLLVKEGYAINASGLVYMEPYKYWHHLHHHLKAFHCRHLAGRFRHYLHRAGTAAVSRLEQHSLLSIDSRPAVVAHAGQLMLKRVHPAHHVLGIAPCTICTGIYLLRLARHRQKENHQGRNSLR